MATKNDQLQKTEAQVTEGFERTRPGAVYVPDTDILEDADNLYLVSDMPGVDEKSVDVTIEKNLLTVRGRVETKEPENHRPAIREYPIGDFERSFTLSTEINRDGIQARMNNGVLELVLPKAETVKPRRIEVQSA